MPLPDDPDPELPSTLPPLPVDAYGEVTADVDPTSEPKGVSYVAREFSYDDERWPISYGPRDWPSYEPALYVDETD